MATVGASALLVVSLVIFWGKNVEAVRWTEVIPADTEFQQSLARFAYLEKNPGDGEGLTFLVTQARYKMQPVLMYNLAFIVLQAP
ncbi:uncharacterized protein LOC142768491 isoform X2 [Rhipicephalus microplus]|uniref:uncharacterized protein LOC142768491 isoform X2 n=1 Tax=Rhipicephalus microplus TaxID=6941 RepID=UPI003F6D3D86